MVGSDTPLIILQQVVWTSALIIVNKVKDKYSIFGMGQPLQHNKVTDH